MKSLLLHLLDLFSFFLSLFSFCPSLFLLFPLFLALSRSFSLSVPPFHFLSLALSFHHSFFPLFCCLILSLFLSPPPFLALSFSLVSLSLSLLCTLCHDWMQFYSWVKAHWLLSYISTPYLSAVKTDTAIVLLWFSTEVSALFISDWSFYSPFASLLSDGNMYIVSYHRSYPISYHNIANVSVFILTAETRHV